MNFFVAMISARRAAASVGDWESVLEGLIDIKMAERYLPFDAGHFAGVEHIFRYAPKLPRKGREDPSASKQGTG